MNRLTRNLWNSVYWSPEAGAGEGGDPGKSGSDSPGKDTTLPKGANGSGGSGDGKDKVWNGLEFKDPENLKAVETKGWQGPEDAVKSYRELEEKSSKGTPKVPGADAKPEEWDAFYKSVGRPDNSKGYEFKISEEVPENFPYDENAATSFKDAALKAGLRPDQAQSLHDWFVGSLTQPWTKSVKDTAAKIEGAHDTIVKDWGDPQGTQYKRNLELADRAIRELGGKDKSSLRKELQEFGIIAPDGKVLAPRLILALAKVGEALYHEDGVFSGEAVTRNPWKPDTENLTEQGKIIKEDPQLAKQLILAANLKPEKYGLGK